MDMGIYRLFEILKTELSFYEDDTSEILIT